MSTPGAMSVPQPAAPITAPVIPQPTLLPVGPSGTDGALTAAALANMSPEQQKNLLGEKLFHYISAQHPDQAGKITGMLLEMDVTEQLNLLESPDLLNSKIAEALEVLQAAGPDPTA